MLSATREFLLSSLSSMLQNCLEHELDLHGDSHKLRASIVSTNAGSVIQVVCHGLGCSAPFSHGIAACLDAGYAKIT